MHRRHPQQHLVEPLRAVPVPRLGPPHLLRHMVSAANLWIDLCSAYSLLTPFPRSVAGYTYSGYVGGLPDCVPCTNQSACDPGFYAPPCLATDGPQPCLPCAASPPANASFSVGCSVACNRGFYNHSGTCVPCSATCPANQIPILCGGDSPPTCMSCYSTCASL